MVRNTTSKIPHGGLSKMEKSELDTAKRYLWDIARQMRKANAAPPPVIQEKIARARETIKKLVAKG